MAVTPVGAGVDARLLVSARDIWGTLGDAARDAKATAQARALLSQPSLDSQLVVLDDTSEPTSVLIDPVRPSDFRVFIFGAGHVGRALARVLGTVSCEVEWIDSRANEFPREVPENVRVMVTERPADRVASAPRGAYYVVLTHSHALDFAILQRVLERGDFAYCGMIGSPTKRRTFENGLAKHGTARAALERLTCPIGIPGLHGKEPGTIAVAVAAQLIGLHEQARAAGPIA
jgi:xanthine dehydrogenase accessory factor